MLGCLQEELGKDIKTFPSILRHKSVVGVRPHTQHLVTAFNEGESEAGGGGANVIQSVGSSILTKMSLATTLHADGVIHADSERLTDLLIHIAVAAKARQGMVIDLGGRTIRHPPGEPLKVPAAGGLVLASNQLTLRNGTIELPDGLRLIIKVRGRKRNCSRFRV
jgi:hypothetical protein